MGPDREPSTHLYMIFVPVPADATGPDAVHVPLSTIPRMTQLKSIDGFLLKLANGPYTLEFRDMMDDSLLATLTWLQAGDAQAVGRSGAEVDATVKGVGSGIKINVLNPGIGASGCGLTIWLRIVT